MGLPFFRPLNVYQGDTVVIVLRRYTDTSRTTAVDMSGNTYESEIKARGGGSALATATIDATLADEGLVRVVFEAADTALLAPGADLVYDVHEIAAGGEVTTLIAGPALVTAEVTT